MSTFDPPTTPDPLTPGITGVDTSTSATGGGAAPKEVAGAAAEQGKHVAGTAVEQGKEVAQTATDDARQVADRATAEVTDVVRAATDEARRMVGQVGGEARTQADSQAERLAEGLRGIAGQLQAAASGQPLEAGPVRDLADQAGAKVDMVAGRLADDGIDGLMQDVGGFARRRPGMFLVGALAGGFVAGRLLRSAWDASGDSSAGSSATSGTSSQQTPERAIDPTGQVRMPAAHAATTTPAAVDPTLVGGVGPVDASAAGIG